MNVILSGELEELVKERLASGAYGSADALFAEALRLLRDRDQSDPSPGVQFEETARLYRLGVEVMQQNLRREFPAATEEEIQRRLQEWLSSDDVSDQASDYFRVAPERLRRLTGGRG